jgi:hypothetical protein
MSVVFVAQAIRQIIAENRWICDLCRQRNRFWFK